MCVCRWKMSGRHRKCLTWLITSVQRSWGKQRVAARRTIAASLYCAAGSRETLWVPSHEKLEFTESLPGVYRGFTWGLLGVNLEFTGGFTLSLPGVYREFTGGFLGVYQEFNGSIPGVYLGFTWSLVYRDFTWGLPGVYLGFTCSLQGVYLEFTWSL